MEVPMHDNKLFEKYLKTREGKLREIGMILRWLGKAREIKVTFQVLKQQAAPPSYFEAVDKEFVLWLEKQLKRAIRPFGWKTEEEARRRVL
jgi:hypothetical protein